jgi:hypothetical protein
MSEDSQDPYAELRWKANEFAESTTQFAEDLYPTEWILKSGVSRVANAARKFASLIPPEPPIAETTPSNGASFKPENKTVKPHRATDGLC